MATVVDPPKIVEADKVFTIYNLDWSQYVAINDALAGCGGLRMIYLDGNLTLLSPTRRHEWHSDAFDGIIKAVALGCGIDFEPGVSTTYRAEGLGVSVEPDRCYYFGGNAILMGGPIDVDLATQPPPDLTIEVEYTNPATDALAIYDRLGVPEVWRYHVKNGTLSFLQREPEGGYEPAPRSRSLPTLAPEDVLIQLRLAAELRSTLRWLEQLPGWVRDAILPRIGQGR